MNAPDDTPETGIVAAEVPTARRMAEASCRAYPGRTERAAMRSGIGDAAHLCDAIERDIRAEHTVRGRVTNLGQQLAAVAKRCGDAVWEMRDMVTFDDAAGETPKTEAPADSRAQDAAALVAAAAPVIRSMDVGLGDGMRLNIALVYAERVAAAALAPALRELAGQARTGHVRSWLRDVADALDAEAGGTR